MKITFGLEAQGHIPTIQAELERWNAIHNEDGDTDMTYSMAVWEAIGKKIGWEPFTAALAYFKWLAKREAITDYSLDSAKKYAIDRFNNIVKKHPRGGFIDNETLLELLEVGVECGYKFCQKEEQ